MRYWDLETNERAALTTEQVKACCLVELMEAGVLQPEPPDLVDEETVEVERETFFAPKEPGTYGDSFGICFPTADEAAQFVALKPMKVESNWRVGSDHKYAKPLAELEIAALRLMTEADYVRLSSDLQRVESAKTANKKARDEFNKATAAVSKATEGLWDDWHECRAHVAAIAKVRADFAEYTKLCEGNETSARVFLLKIHERALIDEALGEAFTDEPEPEVEA
jgi:hypothetical protein